jgi:hypothetical protein
MWIKSLTVSNLVQSAIQFCALKLTQCQIYNARPVTTVSTHCVCISGSKAVASRTVFSANSHGVGLKWPKALNKLFPVLKEGNMLKYDNTKLALICEFRK